MKPNKEMIALAVEKLSIDETEAVKGCRKVEGIEGAYFFTAGGRGAGRLLVTENLESLWAASGISPSRQVEAFLRGRRN
ncbi:MAG TPA: hypothetical protein H9877_04675 [Candidatus Gordonibacter avicola]|nr:hypothetical protein [Candidatus Gordonibacter avicola]